MNRHAGLAQSLISPDDSLERQNEKLRAIAAALIRHAEAPEDDRGTC
jgi:hypothetical protein